MGALAAAAAVLGLAGVLLQDAPYALRLGGEWRPAGPLEYPPALALLVVSALTVFVAAVRAPRPLAARVAGALGLALAAGVLALAQSRIGLALGVAVVALSVAPIRRRPALAAVVVAGGLAAAALAPGSGDGPASGFLHGREDTWRAGLEAFADRPLLGAGADAFLAASARHQDGAAIVFAHNLPLELAVELGLLGLVLALAAYAASARVVRHALASGTGLVFIPAVVAFPLANLLDWPWHLAGMGAIWALACGAVAGGCGSIPNRRGKTSG
jgi:O-antigen ligase